jgi:hypothetical protein
MVLNEKMLMKETADAGMACRVVLQDSTPLPRASMHVQHSRPSRWIDIGEIKIPDPSSYELIDEETVLNQITNVGRDFIHTQSYGTAPAGNGLNYIALTNTAITPAAGDTTLSGEITTNGLARAQATTNTHTAGTNTTTLAITFTCATAPQACQAAALFTASSSGTMNNELTFTQRSLQIGDQITITYTITIG